MKNFSIVALAGLLWLGCISTPEPANDTSAAQASTPTVDLRGVVVGLVGTGILLQNHSPEALLEVDIVINERSGGGFRFHVAEIESNSTQTYLTQVFFGIRPGHASTRKKPRSMGSQSMPTHRVAAAPGKANTAKAGLEHYPQSDRIQMFRNLTGLWCPPSSSGPVVLPGSSSFGSRR